MTSQILFNHIPKTGGTTLRIIFNRVYGTEKVYFINSTNIAGSLQQFRDFTDGQRHDFRAISGHGAPLFGSCLHQPFYISILRDPIDLFYSQYYYLRNSPHSAFLDEVSKISGPEAYLEYALRKGQDNLLTRYLSGCISFLVNENGEIPSMDIQGISLLKKAKENLLHYDVLLNLNTFDKGVYALSKILQWKRIPFYRPANVNRAKISKNPNQDFEEELRHTLRFDLELYDYFINEKLDVAHRASSLDYSWKLFSLKQKSINVIAKLIKK